MYLLSYLEMLGKRNRSTTTKLKKASISLGREYLSFYISHNQITKYQ